MLTAKRPDLIFRRKNPNKCVDARENAATGIASNTAPEPSYEVTGTILLRILGCTALVAAPALLRLWWEISR